MKKFKAPQVVEDIQNEIITLSSQLYNMTCPYVRRYSEPRKGGYRTKWYGISYERSMAILSVIADKYPQVEFKLYARSNPSGSFHSRMPSLAIFYKVEK